MNYLAAVADQIRSQLDPESLPPGDTDELLAIYAVLALALGERVTAADVHDAWVAWMTGRRTAHPSLVPFEELDEDTARSDEPFVDAIRRVAAELALPERIRGQT